MSATSAQASGWIPPLLFASGGLGGPLHNLTVPRLGRVETIGGRACQEVFALAGAALADSESNFAPLR